MNGGLAGVFWAYIWTFGQSLTIISLENLLIKLKLALDLL